MGSEQNVAAARFSVLRFSDKNDITVTVREPAPDNTAKATVNLEKYMIDNNISVDGRNEATVRLLFDLPSGSYSDYPGLDRRGCRS